MQVIYLEPLPDVARRELLDFRDFLMQKYGVNQQQTTHRRLPLAPRLVKPFEPIGREELYER